jgi:hypothetical protein
VEQYIIIDYAHGIDIIGTSVRTVKEAFITHENRALEMRLLTYGTETRYMVITHTDTQFQSVNNLNVKKVTEFKYLDTLITTSNNMTTRRLQGNKKFWEELIAYFPLIRHGQHRKPRLQQFLVAAGTCLPSCCLSATRGYTGWPTLSPMIWFEPHRKRRI